jgi:hypothetical protein
VKPHSFPQGLDARVLRKNNAYLVAKLRQMQRDVLGIGSAARALQRKMVDKQYSYDSPLLSTNSFQASIVRLYCLFISGRPS